MARLAILAAVAAMLVFASPATAQNPGGVEATTPESAGQRQYDPDGPSTQQALEEGIEDAVEDAQESNAAADGAEAYIEALSPEESEAEASEAAVSEAPAEPGASVRYQSLPDTGGPALAVPFTGALFAFLAGGLLLRRR